MRAVRRLPPALRELMPLDATVHLLANGGAHETTTLEALLPRSFGPEYLP